MRTREPLSIPEMLQVFLICTYLAFSGIYWLPGVSHTFLSVAKATAYAALVSYGLLRLRQFHPRSQSILVWLFLAASASFFSNSLNTDLSAGLINFFNFLKPMLWLVALFGVRAAAYPALLRGLALAASAFLCIAMYPVAAVVGLAPILYAPDDFINLAAVATDDPSVFIKLDQGSVVGGGFAGQSTTWAVILPPAALLAVAMYMRSALSPNTKLIVSIASLVGSVASVAITSARGGAIVLTILGTQQIISEPTIGRKQKLLAVIVIPVALIIWVGAYLPENFFRGFDASGNILARADEATTGRIGSWIFALEQFVKSPVLGVGAPNAYYGLIQIHNTFLKLLAESGLVVFLLASGITLKIARTALGQMRALKRHPGLTIDRPPVMWFSIASGLILSFFEPNTIFGNFNASAFFWTAVWVTLVLPTITSGHRNETSPYFAERNNGVSQARL